MTVKATRTHMVRTSVSRKEVSCDAHNILCHVCLQCIDCLPLVQFLHRRRQLPSMGSDRRGSGPHPFLRWSMKHWDCSRDHSLAASTMYVIVLSFITLPLTYFCANMMVGEARRADGGCSFYYADVYISC